MPVSQRRRDPDAIRRAFESGEYPYQTRLANKDYEAHMAELQVELLKAQRWIKEVGERIILMFEGRDAAGKGGTIKRFMEHLNPRGARIVALEKPSERERSQWYFQRYVEHLPSAGEIVFFDRSWYNRAGVERVMGFASEDQVADFLREAPAFEGMLVRDGIKLFKIFLDIGKEMQLKRFHERRHDPLKQWKISEMDLAAMSRFEAYSHAKEEMFRYTHTTVAPWTVILANDQRRARLEAMRLVLLAIDYQGKDEKVVGKIDSKIVGSGPEFFHRPA
ncbi:MAG: polyphosphate kinase 2 [Hyphomicrobiaceae bacterium]